MTTLRNDYLNQIAHQCRITSAAHGFWDHANLRADTDHDIIIENPSIWAEKIALMHSEASEMLEALRDGDEPQLAEECADLLIRLFDFTDARNIDIQLAVEKKMAKNESRPHLHGRKF
jgi:phosphoribosyl-ATP pyrophosphohydrolase